MLKPASVVIVDSELVRRNRVARLLYQSSGHVEPYESVDELRSFWSDAALVMMHDDNAGLFAMFELMHERGCWLPIIVYGCDPGPSRVVDVVLMGAMDYLEWPATGEKLAARLRLLSSRRKSFAEIRRRTARSQMLVNTLTRREREVLFCLANGASNKTAARDLQLSPRTIEIHRANMMGKLGVSHLGEAISIALYSDLSNLDAEKGAFDPLVIRQ